jgi:hypothetical protein
VRAVRTPQEIYRRLTRLVSLYHDHKRLYERRALKLQRLFEKAGLQLEIICHPVEGAAATTATATAAVVVIVKRNSAPARLMLRDSAQPIRRTTDNQACPTREASSRDRENVSKTSNFIVQGHPRKHQPASAMPHLKKPLYFKPSGLWKSGFRVCPAAHK